MPKQKPGKSKQDYETPADFIEAVETRFGKIAVDLAATMEKAKGPFFIGPNSAPNGDGLGTLSPSISWAESYFNGLLWLNPEFRNIDPYAEKCFVESEKRQGLIALLVPASIGSGWYHRWVEGKAMVLGLRPRLTFVGETQCYPKDLMLCVYGYGLHGHGTWRWKGND